MEPFEFTLLPRDIRKEIMGQAEPMTRRRLAQITREPPTIEDCCMLPSTKELINVISEFTEPIYVQSDATGPLFLIKKQRNAVWSVEEILTGEEKTIKGRDRLFRLLKDTSLYFPFVSNIEALIQVLKRRRICQELRFFLETCIYSYLYYETSRFNGASITYWEQIYDILAFLLPTHFEVKEAWKEIKADIINDPKLAINLDLISKVYVLTSLGIEEMRRRTLEVLEAIGPEDLNIP